MARKTMARRMLLWTAFAATLTPSVVWAREGAANAAAIASWESFADQIKETGRAFLSAPQSSDPVTRAEAVRYLTRQLTIALEKTNSADMPQPMLRLNQNDLKKIGLDAAEAKYMASQINGSGVYRLWGHLGTAGLTAVQLYGSSGTPRAAASVSGSDLRPAADGAIEVMIAAERPKGWNGAWVKLDPRDNMLLVREYFNDWNAEEPSKLLLERVDQENVSTAPLTEAHALTLPRAAAAEFKLMLPFWVERSKDFSSKPNTLSPVTAANNGLNANAYGFGYFKLMPDEALLIEMDRTKTEFWSFELGNYWWESLDYVNHVSSLTSAQAKKNRDGRYRLVISAKDPGIANWLDTAGHGEGMILYRYINAKDSPTPAMRKVKLSELPALLPSDTPQATAEDRAANLQMRRRHVAKRWMP